MTKLSELRAARAEYERQIAEADRLAAENAQLLAQLRALATELKYAREHDGFDHCVNCPHGEDHHAVNNSCLVAGCDCKGYVSCADAALAKARAVTEAKQ